MKIMYQINDDTCVDLDHVIAVHPGGNQSVIVFSGSSNQGGQGRCAIYFDDVDGRIRRDIVARITDTGVDDGVREKVITDKIVVVVAE